MARFTMVFNMVRVPITPHKTLGPTVNLQCLGIFIDTDRMEARLPDDKLSDIITIMDIFTNKHSISKRELLSLLGHLKFCFQGNSKGSKLCSLSLIFGSLCDAITSTCDTRYSYVA